MYADDNLINLLKYSETHHKKRTNDFCLWDLDKVLLMLKNPPSMVKNKRKFLIQKTFLSFC